LPPSSAWTRSWRSSRWRRKGLVGIVVNLQDYTVGADRGGETSMFDDFDIDYNQYKYLLETRSSGALTKIRSAIIIRQAAQGETLVTPAAPTFDPATSHITIHDTAGVTYRRSDTNAVVTNAAVRRTRCRRVWISRSTLFRTPGRTSATTSTTSGRSAVPRASHI
jgi:hypothetical protein